STVSSLTITGGEAAGISGITSNSGTGTWVHTGGFSATGGINSTSVGATTPSTGAFTTLSASSTVSGAGFSTYLASPPPIGSTSAGTGKFTTLEASNDITNDRHVLSNATALSGSNVAFGTGAGTSPTLNSISG